MSRKGKSTSFVKRRFAIYYREKGKSKTISNLRNKENNLLFV